MMVARRALALRWAAGAGLALALFATWFFASRAYESYTLLRSATEFGLPAVASVRPWMTLGYLANTYEAPLAELAASLDLPKDAAPSITLYSIAESRQQSMIAFILEVQEAVAVLSPEHPPGEAVEESPTAVSISDTILSALLTYRYPILALVLLCGAIGLPVPTGFSTVLAGSMVAGGEMNLALTVSIALGASLAGDAIGYGAGRLVHESFLVRYGHLFGLTQKTRNRVQGLFRRWGGLTVLLTRTLVSHLSSVASLLAGISHYHFSAFAASAVAGRVMWTVAYFGLGYLIGNEIEAAGIFLAQVTGTIVSLGVIFILASYLVAALSKASA